jgi:1,3-propanediol dehydrogenase
MVVSDTGVIEAGWVDRAAPHLMAAGPEFVLWSALTPNPKDHEVEPDCRIYQESGCDALLAIGGGSCSPPAGRSFGTPASTR